MRPGRVGNYHQTTTKCCHTFASCWVGLLSKVTGNDLDILLYSKKCGLVGKIVKMALLDEKSVGQQSSLTEVGIFMGLLSDLCFIFVRFEASIKFNPFLQPGQLLPIVYSQFISSIFYWQFNSWLDFSRFWKTIIISVSKFFKKWLLCNETKHSFPCVQDFVTQLF